MGSSSSKFKKYLHHGDEFAAMQVFQSSPELQKNLNPNLSYGEHYNHDTALHFAAKHGMKHLLRTFLNDLGGNPNKKNGNNETSLHCACQLNYNKTFSAMERRATCVMFIMQWRGASVESGGREKIDLAAQDQNGNTALHMAAASGLEHCVQALISAGSPLYLENNDKLTPCDMAVKNGHYGIAQLLESKMVFDDTLDIHNEDELSQSLGEADEVYCGLRTQDLQEAKDQLLVETSDMLQVPLFTAEALLRDNEWSREVLLDKWMKDAVSCCQLAGVEPPQFVFNEQGDVTLDSVPNAPTEQVDITCDICMLTVKASERPSIKISCNHNFCFQCWETYLSNKILEGMPHDILCPAYQCHILVPIDVIERLVSPDLARRYLHFDIKAFVESNKCIKWCPIAGCGRAVRLPETEQRQAADEVKNLYNGKPIPVTSQAVDCGNGHFFCWECLGEAHAPSGCTQWRQWLEKINQVKPEELNNDMKDLEDASNCLWLVSNSKPCPNCKSPIQKNEGCNHIKCSKCKYDFCWICLEAWKKHSSATGGYFRCNRFPAAYKADEKQGILISEAVARSQQIQELNRFLHYYTRYKNHEHSRKLEESLLTTVNHKMEVLASSLVNGKVTSDKEKKCTKFVEDGIRELLKARRVLCGSYVHGFYLEDLGYNKTIFEFMQNELEAVTEKLSEMIARPYLKTPRHTIMQTASLCRRKRHEFVRAVSKGLIPPETPPTFRKRKRRFPGIFVMDPSNEDDMSHLIVASLKSVDVNNPWVKDSQGRHTNLTAIYDWPDFDSEEETEVSRALAVSLVGECCREGCNRPKARNPRTQALHDYCSLRCARNGIQLQSFTHDESMDLIIALEMSRLQMIEDAIKRENQYRYKSSVSSSVTQTCSDADLNKAIELSIHQEKTDVGVTTEDITLCKETAIDKNVDYFSSRTNEDLTVDYFLKSLAGRNFQEVTEKSVNIYSPDSEKILREKELVTFRTEDGRFEISDIHETCFHQEESDEQCLRRVRSTGDLTHKDTRKNQYKEDPRYHLDSDHSSQHVERPEEFAKISLAIADNLEKSKKGDHYVLFQEHSGSSAMNEGTCTQSSVDDTISSDSVIADLEVCNILSSGEISRIRADESLTNFEAGEKQSNSTLGDIGKFKTAKSEDQLSYIKNVENSEIYDQNISNSAKFEDENSSKTLDIKRNVSEASLRSESVKNLIEEVRHTLNSIEADRNPEFLNSHCGGKDSIGQKGNEFLRHCPERASTGKIKSTQMMMLENQKSTAKSATALESLKDSDKRLFSMRKTDSNNFLLVGSENSLNEAHKKAFKAAGGKIFKNSNLRIRIQDKSPVVTDSSNEYETETGIPKSPTLFISGVSISRTPEPCVKDKKSPEHKSRKSGQILKSPSNLRSKNYSSPVLNLILASAEKESEAEDSVIPAVVDKNMANSGRQGRSSSLTNTRFVPEKKRLNVSCGSLAYSDKRGNSRKDSVHHGTSISSRNSITFEENNRAIDKAETSPKNTEGSFVFGIHNESGSHDLAGCKKEVDGCDGRPIVVKENLIEEAMKRSGKSKSASEPEREREMFTFPKSSTDGALSSVLHVHENYLSSDDFHEVLFLLERSPKHGSKRKKRSKRERDKIKENSSKEECAEVSSAL